MAASIFIIAVSAALIVYWFRYTCLLMLRTRTSRDHATDIAAANDLAFAGIPEEALRNASGPRVADLERSLDRDYRLLTYLLAHTAGLQVGGLTMEQRMLMLDFRLMQAVCFVAGRLGLPQARAALLEMTEVLARLANDMGERIHAASRA